MRRKKLIYGVAILFVLGLATLATQVQGFLDLNRLAIKSELGKLDYPKTVSVDIGQSMKINGIANHARYFKCSDPAAQVLAYYAGNWKADRLPVAENIGGDSGFVAAIDSCYLISVTAYTDEHGTTHVFPALLDLSQEPTNERVDSVPIYQGSSEPVIVETQDYDCSVKTITSSNPGSLMSNISFYQSRMLGEGWKYEDMPADDENRTGKVLSFSKGNQECSISLQRAVDGDGTAVMIHLVERT